MSKVIRIRHCDTLLDSSQSQVSTEIERQHVITYTQLKLHTFIKSLINAALPA